MTLQAVPKLSCKAKIVSMSAVPSLSKDKIPVIRPKDAITVPPGTPGAPIPKSPSRSIKINIFDIVGKVPYRTWETTMTKKTSVRTEPHKWILEKSGMAKFMVSFDKIVDLLAQVKETGRVAAEDIVPSAVQ